jgi:hypothetical protein
MRHFRSCIAAFLAPAPLLLFMYATSDGLIPRGPAFIIAGVATAHLFFWFPYFSAKLAGTPRRLRAKHRPTVSTYATSAFLLSCSASVIAQGFHDQFSWALLARDSIALSVAAVGSYIFYLALAQKPVDAKPVSSA